MASYEQWEDLARNWGIKSDYTLQGLAPAGVSCRTCWGFNVCGECLGEYPTMCPVCADAEKPGACVDCVVK